MALKDNIAAIKNELSSQDQWFENLVKSERFFKKNRKKIFITIFILIIAAVTYLVFESIKEKNLQISNEAYRVLLIAPDDLNSLDVLKSKNKPLYRLFTFQEAVKNSDKIALQALIDENNKDFVADLASYQLGDNNNVKLFDNFVLLEEGFALLKDGKTEEAARKFSIIQTSSALARVAKDLEHYQKIEAK